jgi:hypothetical protein
VNTCTTGRITAPPSRFLSYRVVVTGIYITLRSIPLHWVFDYAQHRRKTTFWRNNIARRLNTVDGVSIKPGILEVTDAFVAVGDYIMVCVVAPESISSNDHQHVHGTLCSAKWSAVCVYGLAGDLDSYRL